MIPVILVGAVVIGILVFVMQLVILSRIGKMGKEIKETLEKSSGQSLRRGPQRDDNGRRPRLEGGRDPRRERTERTPEQGRDNRNRPVAPAPASVQAAQPIVSGVDSSLRDINLKLKNVEKSQETARRQVRDFSNDSDSQDRNRNSSRRRGGGRNRRPRSEGDRENGSESKASADPVFTDERESNFDANEPKVAVRRRVLDGTEEFGGASAEESSYGSGSSDSGPDVVSVPETTAAPVFVQPVSQPVVQPQESASVSDQNVAKPSVSFGRR